MILEDYFTKRTIDSLHDYYFCKTIEDYYIVFHDCDGHIIDYVHKPSHIIPSSSHNFLGAKTERICIFIPSSVKRYKGLIEIEDVLLQHAKDEGLI